MATLSSASRKKKINFFFIHFRMASGGGVVVGHPSLAMWHTRIFDDETARPNQFSFHFLLAH